MPFSSSQIDVPAPRRPAAPPAAGRRLATLLFTDIVGSTEHAASLGDGRWRELLRRHDALVREAVEHHRGRVVKSLGDGVLAVFDGPSRALGAALAIRDGAGTLGLVVRGGVHTGECEPIGEDLLGIAVHIGARVAARARPRAGARVAHRARPARSARRSSCATPASTV